MMLHASVTTVMVTTACPCERASIRTPPQNSEPGGNDPRREGEKEPEM